MNVTIVELTGNETDEQCKDVAWQMFCNAHPVEAYQHNPEKFWKYFHERAPNITREQMVNILKECEANQSDKPRYCHKCKAWHSADDAGWKAECE